MGRSYAEKCVFSVSALVLAEAPRYSNPLTSTKALTPRLSLSLLN